MVAYVTTNQLGVDLLAAYDAITTALPENPGHPHVYGSRVTATDGSEWIFGKVNTGATINTKETVMINRTCDLVIPSLKGTGLVNRGTRPGSYQGLTQLTAGMAAWFMISGAPEIKAIGPALPNVALYTTTTSGVLSTTTASTSEWPMRGMHLTVTASGTTASAVVGIMTFPTIGSLSGGD